MSCGSPCPHCGNHNHCQAAVCAACRRRLDGRAGLGDAVHGVTRRLGVPHCDGCAQRKAALNRVPIPWSGRRRR